ncbi:hypothetical protein RE0356_10320 [Prescottella equi]|nr:hypothetical protein RE0356_10320 [Prescottella equi]
MSATWLSVSVTRAAPLIAIADRSDSSREWFFRVFMKVISSHSPVSYAPAGTDVAVNWKAAPTDFIRLSIGADEFSVTWKHRLSMPAAAMVRAGMRSAGAVVDKALELTGAPLMQVVPPLLLPPAKTATVKLLANVESPLAVTLATYEKSVLPAFFTGSIAATLLPWSMLVLVRLVNV